MARLRVLNLTENGRNRGERYYPIQEFEGAKVTEATLPRID
ncbi:MAG: hypothetical protein ACLQGU_08430 [bacterium]